MRYGQRLRSLEQILQELLASDIIDVDERGDQAQRDKLWDGRTERKPLNQEQGLGDYISG